ncbi:MAG: hypothetical protein DI585_02160 [Pseudomonas fluorescens]|nr:MAG: hypothetical protein DI585_02160 [Pseudomonas fluorescens]
MAVCVAALGLTACGRAAPPPRPNASSCMGMADNLKTLRTGDELPRVVQVLGMPTKTIRVKRVFGSSLDVMEYQMTPNPCLQAVLQIEKKKSTLYVIFDSKGRYVRTSGMEPYGFWNGLVYSTSSVGIDPVVLNP